MQNRADLKLARAHLPLKIGIDGDALRLPASGVGHYVYNMCSELERMLPNAQLFAYSRLPRERLKLPSSRWILRSEPSKHFSRLPSFAWLKSRGRQMCLKDELDVFWAGRSIHPRLPSSVRTVSSVHDLNHLVVPETMQPATYWSNRLWFAGDIRSASAIVANSEGTANRLQDLLGVRAHAVCRPGLHRRFHNKRDRQTDGEVVARLGIRPPYFLWVGTLEPRKNLEVLVRAFSALKLKGQLPAHSLVLVGASGWQTSRLAQIIGEAQPHSLVATGYVDDDTLPALYSQAHAFIFPSIYEGYGMPVLEALACGTNVLMSDVPELTEAAGGQAATFDGTQTALEHHLLRIAESVEYSAAPLVTDHTWTTSAHHLCRVMTADPLPYFPEGLSGSTHLSPPVVF